MDQIANDSSSGSVGTAFQQLIKCLTKAKHRHLQLEPDLVDRDREHQHLKKKLYETLFSKLNGPLSRKHTVDNEKEKCKVRTKEHLLQVVFQLRRRRKFDKGQRLEKLIEGLPDLEYAQHSDLKATIEVLLTFAGSQSSPIPTLGYRMPDLPHTGSKDEVVTLPTGHLYHGDSKYLYKQESGVMRYVHYSRELFEGLDGTYSSSLEGQCGIDSAQPYALDYQVLNAEPGKDLHGKGLFNIKPILGNPHERGNRITLFHALTKSKTSSLDVKLTVPALPDTNNPDLLGLKVPLRNEMSDDEGFHEASSTPSLAETPSDDTDAFWEAVLNYKPNKHLTWETIGRHARTTERPYLTEAGYQAVDELYKVLCHQASMLGGQPLRSNIILLDQQGLVRDALHALIAVPSKTFLLDQANQCLTVNTDVCLQGTTPQSFHHLLKDFTIIGTNYLRLSLFARPRTMDSSYTGGLVLQAFTTGVRRFLQYYQALVQMVPPETQHLTLLAVKDRFSELTGQLRYLSDLCMCGQRGGDSKPGDIGDPFPIGINLLSYLYQEALDCRNIQKYRLALSLLRISCGPYLMHIQDWVFHGICHDIYGEFMITINDTYLRYRDKYYWTNGYMLTTPNVEDNVPIFLQDMAYDIYVCGKSINLLKLCCPEHFVCNPDTTLPRVGLTFSPDELQETVDKSREYLKNMLTIAKMKTISREEKEHQDEEAKQSLLAEARRTAAQELKRIQDLIRTEKIAADEKKRGIFQELKAQMQKDIVRRALAVETERQEDVERIEEVKRREQAEADTETELERQAREEVIEYYAKLTEEAAEREQRALWRIRRHRLDQRRAELILQEEESFRQALNLRSMVGILPSGSESVSKATEEKVDGEDVVMDDQMQGVKSGIQSDPVPESIVGVSSEEADALSLSTDHDKHSALESQPPVPSKSDHGHDGGNAGQQKSVRFKNQREQRSDAMIRQTLADGLLIALGDSTLETGDLTNEDIESTLNLIQGDDKSTSSKQHLHPAKSIAAPMNLMDLSISDFLPKEGNEDDDKEEENAVINPEAEVEDVLLTIGSDLPAKSEMDEASSAAANILDELLGLSSVSKPKTDLEEAKKSDQNQGRRKEWVKPRPLSGHPSDSQLELGQDANSEQVQRKDHVHGHASDSHFTVGQEMTASEKPEGQNQNVYGHASHSHFTVGQEITVEGEQSTSKNVHGHASDSHFTLGKEVEEKGEEKEHSKNIHGHASDSHFKIGQETGKEDDQKQQSKNAYGHASDSNFTLGQDMSGGAGQGLQQPNIYGHASDSHFTTGQNAPDISSDLALGKPNVHGHSSDSTICQALHHSGDGDMGVPAKPANIHGHASDSSAGGILYPSPDGDSAEHSSIPSKVASESILPKHSHAIPDLRSVHGHTTDSTIQSLMYPTSQDQLPLLPDDSTASGARSKQRVLAHPSDSTAQRLLYGRSVLSGQPTLPTQIQDIVPQQELEETVIWAGDGVESFQDVFNIFDASPGTDLLAAVGFVPLSTEIGDYGVQASDSDSLEADEKMSLPVIIKRSVTTPLVAQIGLVNQSMLDYYLVELGIDKHFIALRSFLFLEDGEFGQSLCDQLFDKLAQGLRPAELLSPIVLNQVLPRAIQSSANRESEYAQLLGFALKWLPPFFKPNAIDTFDCLQLRYRVDWPFNIVITETCLIKYNKVFSFLLQLKRTSWVLRDIYFQLKRSATVNYAGNSPQFRQLQLFRHEMQHFVSVMQGYVVNQVIHVTWGEFQRELKTSVHNLDDLHQKHAEYLNKAVFRCLLNKKASTLMKIITDILCLILKVRTQLMSSSWVYDQASHTVVHPAFQTIKSSYLAFKDYSGFLYKVVTKLVTRGYQPHLEEFLLRLNFNDFYEES